MRYIGIITLLVLCLTLSLFTSCMGNTGKPEPDSGNLENQEDIDQSSNNFQSISTGQVEEPVIEEDTEATGMIYPQKWATGDGTAENPWANDCIQKAYDAVPIGGTIYLRAGYYQLADTLSIEKTINFIGEGMGKTIIVTVGGTVRDGLSICHAEDVSMRNLTIDGDAQTLHTDSQCVLGVLYSDYITVENVEIMNGGWYGINPFQSNNCLFHNVYSHDNYRHGLHPGSDEAGRNKFNTYRDIYAWNNGVDGFGDNGINIETFGLHNEYSYNVYDNIQAWDNGRHGITIWLQNGISLSNSSAWGNGTAESWDFGIDIRYIKDSSINNCSANSNDVMGIGLNYSNNVNINNCFSTLNVSEGIRVENSDDINFTNVIVKNNGTGININTCNNITLTSCQSYDDRVTPLQDYGLELGGTNTEISLLNCKLSPNSRGEIYNPTGVVITEKMLTKF